MEFHCNLIDVICIYEYCVFWHILYTLSLSLSLLPGVMVGVCLWGCSSLGKRLGKAMGAGSKEVKSMTQAQILDFEKAGEARFAGHVLALQDLRYEWHNVFLCFSSAVTQLYHSAKIPEI